MKLSRRKCCDAISPTQFTAVLCLHTRFTQCYKSRHITYGGVALAADKGNSKPTGSETALNDALLTYVMTGERCLPMTLTAWHRHRNAHTANIQIDSIAHICSQCYKGLQWTRHKENSSHVTSSLFHQTLNSSQWTHHKDCQRVQWTRHTVITKQWTRHSELVTKTVTG